MSLWPRLAGLPLVVEGYELGTLLLVGLFLDSLRAGLT